MSERTPHHSLFPLLFLFSPVFLGSSSSSSMTTETIPSSSSSSSLPPVSTEDSHPLSLPVFLATSSSSLKPLRERNRTNLKRRINLSRSQVLSRDFENDHHPPPSPAAAAATTPHKTARPTSQSSSTRVYPTLRVIRSQARGLHLPF